jgi:hypothetical protein
MLRWIVLILVVVALTAAATFLTQYAPDSTAVVPAVPIKTGPQPKVAVPGPLTHEFGSMSQLSDGRHTWEFQNVGEADLELWLEGTTCSCTIAKLKAEPGKDKKREVVKPKKSTTIDLEWQTKLFHDDYTKGATIGTNDPARPSIQLNVHGKVYPPVIVMPTETISFNAVSNEELNEFKLAIFSVDRPDLKIKKMTTSRPAFLVTHTRPLTKEECQQMKITGGCQVVLEMKQGMPLGRFADELVIETDHPKRSELKLPITGSVSGPISVIPEQVRMPSVTSREGARRDSTIFVRGGRPTEFEVAYAPKKLKVEITLDDSGTQKGRYRMTISVPKGTPAGSIQDEIILRTDHPRATELKIPVNILISNVGSS